MTLSAIDEAARSSDEPSGTHRISVVIPTLNEAEGISELLNQLAGALLEAPRPTGPDGRPRPVAEVIVVDDSSDDTPEVVRRLAADFPFPLRVHHRDRGVGGLGGAVVEGIGLATGDWVVVMDADLQHPPATVPALVATAEQATADLVVASRYASGGSRSGLSNRYRRLVSSGSTFAAKLAFPRLLHGISDPMSGFFAIRRSTIATVPLRPLGFKILLELVVRCRPGRVAEVAYPFGERYAGASKSSLREGWRFLRHLGRLRLTRTPGLELVLFGLVGLSGFVPNVVVTWLLTQWFGVPYVLSAALATQVAIVWNFVLVDLLVWRDRRERPPAGRFGLFFAVSNLDLVIRLPLLAGLVELAHVGYVFGTILTLLAMFLLRFTLTSRVVYPDRPARGIWRTVPGRLRRTSPDDATTASVRVAREGN